MASGKSRWGPNIPMEGLRKALVAPSEAPAGMSEAMWKYGPKSMSEAQKSDIEQDPLHPGRWILSEPVANPEVGTPAFAMAYLKVMLPAMYKTMEAGDLLRDAAAKAEMEKRAVFMMQDDEEVFLSMDDFRNQLQKRIAALGAWDTGEDIVIDGEPPARSPTMEELSARHGTLDIAPERERTAAMSEEEANLQANLKYWGEQSAIRERAREAADRLLKATIPHRRR